MAADRQGGGVSPSTEDSRTKDPLLRESEDSPKAKKRSGCSFLRRCMPSRRLLTKLTRYSTMRGMFRLLGQNVGEYPLIYIALSVVLASFSLGMLQIHLEDRIRDGYTPYDAPSRREVDVVREFWNSTGDPMAVMVLLTALDGGSMLRDEYIEDVNELNDYIINNFTITSHQRDIRYSDVCKLYCNDNDAVRGLKALLVTGKTAKKVMDKVIGSMDRGVEGILLSMIGAFVGAESSSTGKNTFDTGSEGADIVAKGLGSTLDAKTLRMVTMNLFGINRTEPDTNQTQPKARNRSDVQMNIVQTTTNIEYVKVVVLNYRADKDSRQRSEQLKEWELELFNFITEEYENSRISVKVIGSEIIEYEIIKAGQKMTPYFAAAFGFMMLFVMASMFISALFYNAMDWGKVLIALCAVSYPVLSITTTYGLVSLFQMRTNSFMLVMPFLIMGIGVDDGFLLTHAWQLHAMHCRDVNLRLGLVFEEVGPSMTITSLTNFISFAIGSLAPTPEIQLFCIATALALALDYIFALILFGPVLAISAAFERRRDADETKSLRLRGWRLKADKIKKFALKYYCRIIAHPVFTAVLLCLMVVYWSVAIYGSMTIRTRLDTVKILPSDSPILEPHRILNDLVWVEQYPVTVLVNSQLDFNDSIQVKQLWRMVDDFEALPKCRGNTSTLLWLRDYQTFLDIPPGDRETPIELATLDKFLELNIYEHWKSSIRINRSREGPLVSKFSFTVICRNVSDWEQRIEMTQQWRGVAKQYGDLNVTVWDTNGMFVDQMLSLKYVTMQTTVLTLVCMIVVCLIFIPNPCSVIMASFAIASISIGVYGFLSWWSLDLDPVTMAAILMSIGMSVDFTAHVSYQYQLTRKKRIRSGELVRIPVESQHEKLEHTLQSVGWPMIQAGTSTVICVLPLLFLQSYSPRVFVKTIILVVSWGLLHGLVVLPAFLGALPDFMTEASCCETLRGNQQTATASQSTFSDGSSDNANPSDGDKLSSDAADQ